MGFFREKDNKQSKKYLKPSFSKREKKLRDVNLNLKSPSKSGSGSFNRPTTTTVRAEINRDNSTLTNSGTAFIL